MLAARWASAAISRGKTISKWAVRILRHWVSGGYWAWSEATRQNTSRVTRFKLRLRADSQDNRGGIGASA